MKTIQQEFESLDREPNAQEIDTTIKAFREAIDFRSTRGRLLRKVSGVEPVTRPTRPNLRIVR